MLVGYPLTHIEPKDIRVGFASNEPEAAWFVRGDWIKALINRKVFRDGCQPFVRNERTPDNAVHDG